MKAEEHLPDIGVDPHVILCNWIFSKDSDAAPDWARFFGFFVVSPVQLIIYLCKEGYGVRIYYFLSVTYRFGALDETILNTCTYI